MKWLGISVLSLIAFLMLCVALLYIPFIQGFVVNKALDEVNSGGEMNISLDRFRLRFPLNVDVSGLEIMQRGDTMVMAGSARIDVALFPLITGTVKADGISLREIYFKQGTPDSTLYLRARVDTVDVDYASVSLPLSNVDIGSLAVRSGKIRLALKNDTTPPSPPSEVAWRIHARKLDVVNVDYGMTMEGTIADIGVKVDRITVSDGDVNLRDNKIKIADVAVDGVDSRFLTLPEPVAVAEEEADTFPSRPLEIELNRLKLERGSALYAMKGAEPRKGLDFNYLKFSDITVGVDSFAMKGTEMRVPLTALSATERSGITLEASGVFSMDSTKVSVDDFMVNSLGTNIKIDAVYGLLSDNPSLQPVEARLEATIAPAFAQKAFPEYGKIVEMLPQNRDLTFGVDVDGTMADLNVRQVSASMQGYWDVVMSGRLSDVTDLDSAEGSLEMAGRFVDLSFLRPQLKSASIGRDGLLPQMTINGNVELRKGIIDGNIAATAGDGRLALDAYWNNRLTGYDFTVDAKGFPVNSFMPGLGVTDVTAKIEAKGQGLDPFSPKTRLAVDADAINVGYNGYRIHDLKVGGTLSEGQAVLNLTSDNRVLDMTMRASGNLSGDSYDWKFNADARHIDLKALGVMDTVSSIATRLEGDVSLNKMQRNLRAEVTFPDFNFIMGTERIAGTDLRLGFDATDSTTVASADNHDLHLRFDSDMGLDTIMTRTSSAMDILNHQIEIKRADITGLQEAMPRFRLTASAGRNNIVWSYLHDRDITFNGMRLSMTNDSLINITAAVDTLISGSTRIDNINFVANQTGQYLRYRLLIDNQPGTFDEFANVQANGYLADDKMALFLRQQDIKGKVGYQLGTIVAMTDSTFSFKLVPFKPVIAYKQWNINNDNYIVYNFRHPSIDADLTMTGNESSLRLYTRRDTTSDIRDERVFLTIDNVKISDWLSLSPYSPPMKGTLSADINVGMEGTGINGRGEVTLADFTYDRRRVGSLDLNFDLTTGMSGAVHATTGMKIDGAEVMTAAGYLNDSTARSPLLLDLKLIHFPLSAANAFLGKNATLSGFLEGSMDVSGTMKRPRLDGYVNFDSAEVRVGMIGTTFSFTGTKIPVDSNVIRFNDYKIYGANDNPLAINGVINMHSPTNIDVDMSMSARNMQIVGNDKKRGSDVYGKAFISTDASVQGNLRFLNVQADLTLNSATNVTYIIPDATSQLTRQSTSEMVKFVNFADTAAVEIADTITSPATAINVDAMLRIQQGAVVTVDLNADGSNKVQLQPQGTLDYSLSPMGDSRLTGRLNINGGFARYSLPPLINEKLFNFQEGSYVGFSGDMMNPQLNIKAVDQVLANVTQEGQNSRLVNFDVELGVTGTLNQMNVKFDLSTDDDVTVQNELQSMSPDQRANQAMNLLLYNTYTGPGTKASANLSGNPLYSFLESTVNSWMANNIKGVDISFGIDQYQRTLDGAQSTATNYSYKVSKSFLNDRIKIVVGGNYSTDADTDENMAQNLINDISFEYTLNKSGTMIVRLFRHTGYESIIEGEVTQTGVGFVYKRKVRRLTDLLRHLRRRNRHQDTPGTPATETQVVPPTETNNGKNDK